MKLYQFFVRSYRIVNLLVVLAMVLGAPLTTIARVWTDPTDYSPGSTVWIQGDNSDGAAYQLGETVHVDVVGPLGADGQPYTATCEDAVEEPDPVGKPGYYYWTCPVTLWDSLYAVGSYEYTATGLTSGVVEVGTFTDGDPTISPLRVAIWSGLTQQFTASGGTPPYTFSLLVNDSGATITADGFYTAGYDGVGTDIIDTVLVTDSKGGTSTAWVYVGDMGNGETVINGCMQDLAGIDLNCTAEDVRIASITNIVINDDGCSAPGDTVTFTADYAIDVGASERYDIGLYFAVDGDPNGDGAYTGECSISTLPYRPYPPYLDLDGTIAGVQDTCGDMGDKYIDPLTHNLTLTVECKDETGDGFLDLPYCSSWRVLASDLCTSPLDAFPSEKSKCNCEEGYSIPVPIPGQIIVDKVTDPSGAETSFDFTLMGSYTDPSTSQTVNVNQSFSLTDAAEPWGSDYLYAGSYALTELAEPGWTPTSVTCTSDKGNTEDPANILLDASEIVTCTFYNLLNVYSLNVEKASTTTSVTAIGQVVPYTFVVTNTGNQPLTGITVTDAMCDAAPVLVSGDDGDSILELTETWTYTCSHTVTLAEVAGSYLSNTVTVDSNESEPDTDTLDIPLTYVPVIMVEKSSTTTSVTAAGQVVPYTFLVTNGGNVPLTGITVTDAMCDVAPVYVSGDDGDSVLSLTETWTYTCDHTVTQVEIDTGGNLTNTVTADSNESEPDTDDYYIPITQSPAIDIQKTPDTQTVIYGQTATFTIVVTNMGNVTLSNITVSDPLAPACATTIASLAVGASTSYTCSLANVTSSFTNVATASVTYGSLTITDWDDAVVVVDVLPDISVTKTASPTSVPETGADVTFTFVVTNNASEPFILNSLTDTVFDDLTTYAGTTCVLPQTIAASGTYTCSVIKFIASDTLTDHYNVVTASGVDEQGNPDSASDSETVDVTNVAPAIRITKTASPTSVPETGGDVTFTFLVENIGQEDVTLTTLSDTLFGDLDGKGTCDVPQTILIGGTYSCTYTITLASDSLTAHTNVVTATAVDDDGTSATDTDDETVTFTDVVPAITITKTANPTSVPETGGNVTFTFLVQNTGQEDVTLTSLTDTVFGDLNGQGDCAVPQTILIGGSYSCSFTKYLSSDSLTAHYNVVTATAVDDDGTSATDDDDETVTFTDVAPAIQITKTASPTSVPETGGSVTFTFLVQNTGQEDVTLTSLTDTVFGDLNGQGDCAVPQTILIGGSYSCSFTKYLSSDSLTAHYNVVTATAVDDDGTSATDDDDETVTFTDVAPAIQITKTANPASVPETGGNVTFTFLVENIGQEDVTLTSLTDTVFGDLNGQGDCAVPQTILIGDSYSCSITVNLSSDSLTAHTNVVTAIAVDDDGTTTTDDDTETVTFTDVAPAITITKTANPASVPETGGYVVFSFKVENVGFEDVTLTSLVDDVFGNLTGYVDPDGTCTLPQTIQIGGFYSCMIQVWLEADDLVAHTNVVTATAVDDDGTQATDDDDETVTFTDVAPAITITKTASPASVPETGGSVTFTFLVENTGQEDVTLTTLSDTVFGDLNGQGDCAVPQTILIGDSYSCSITVNLSSDSLTAHYNVVTATAVDDDGTSATDDDDETVTVTNVPPAVTIDKSVNVESLYEPGGVFIFTLTITNDSSEEVTITSLTDTNALSEQCLALIGTQLAAGASTSCAYTVSHTDVGSWDNTAAVEVTDNDNSTATDDDSQTVSVLNVNPTVDLTKTAVPTTLPEPGGDFVFTLSITNNSVEAVTITALTDDNALSAECVALVNTSIPVGGTVSCTYTVSHTDAGTYPNTASVTVADNEVNPASDSDSETVTVTDVMPAVDLTKTAVPTTLPEPGGDFVFTLSIHNSSVEDVTITALTDNNALSAECLALVNTSIPVGGTVSCTYTVSHTDAGTYPNTASVTVADNEGNTASDSDSETVTVTDVLPTVDLTKSVDGGGTFNVGDTATFTLLIKNTSVEAVTITDLTDDYALSAECLALVGTELATGASVSCTYTVIINTAGIYQNTASVTVQDNELNPASATDTESVTYYAPTITKTANGTYDEVHIWEVVKTVNTLSQTAVAGQKVSYTWTIRVDESVVGEDYWVSGDIVIVNPNPDDSMDITLTDELDDGTTATITGCMLGEVPLDQNPDGSWTIPAGSTVTCDYEAEPTGDLEDFAAGLPASVTINSTNPGPDSYWLTTISGGTSLDGVYEAWCVDLDHTMYLNTNYTALVYSSYETLPTGLIEKPYNLDLVNWLINQNFVGTASTSGLGIYTYGDVQLAIWNLIEDNVTIAAGLGSYSLPRVNELVALATAKGEGFVPTCGDTIAVVLVPTDSSQPIAIAQVTFASLGVDCATSNTVTAVFNGFEFPAEAEILWTWSVVDATAELADNQNPALPVTLDADALYPYTDSYICSTNPADYNEYGYYKYTDPNTALLTIDSGQLSSSATTAVNCYYPKIEVTKTADPTMVPETGGDVTFTFVVKNLSTYGSVTIASLSDDVHGTLAGDDDCKVGIVLAVGASCTFSFTTWVEGDFSGPDHVNVFTATAKNAANLTVSDSDDATVDFTNVLPTIEVTKTPSVTEVPETGGDVLFTFVVKNTSTEEPVTITSLFDSVYGTLAGDDDCKLGTVLVAGASCEFSITEWVEGDYSGPDHVNLFTAKAVDNDGSEAMDDDNATVDFTNVLPTIDVTKTANPTEVPETGGDVTFTFVVKNTSSEEPVTITSLYDSVYGTLDGDDDCKLGTVLAAGTSCEFSITRFVKGDYESGVAHVDVFTAKAVDNDDSEASDFDDATVTFTDLTASIDVEKYVSVDGGLTWVDADTATGPYLLTSNDPQFKFVVTNTGTAPLTSVTLTDSDFSLATCAAIPLPFAVDATYECIITATWAAGQHTDTATVSGSFVDGAGNTESDSDTDDANYFGASPSFTVAKDCASTQPIPQEGPALFTVTFYNDGNVDLTITADDGIGTFTLAVGASKSFEVTMTGPFSGQATVYNLVSASASYTDDARHTWTATPSDDASCRVGSRLNVKKTTNGVVNPSMTWTFSLFAGPDGFGTTPLASASTAADVDGVLIFNNVNLDSLKTYTLCENAVAAGWTATFRVDTDSDGDLDLVIPYNPDYDPDPLKNQDLGNRCVDFGAGTNLNLLTDGGTLRFEVDNTYPGGEPRTPGYWKNWNTCTGGGQAATALVNGGWEAGFWLLDDVLAGMGQAEPIVWDDILVDTFLFPINTCELGVTILNAYDIYGTNRNSDGAYTLAKHLLAAQLNYGAGARTCDAASDAILAGEKLLDKYNFNATAASYLSSNSKDKTIKADYALALSIAATLDKYNNGMLCLGPSVTFKAPLDGDVLSGAQVTLWVDAYDTAPVIQVEFFVDGVSVGLDTDGDDLWKITWDSTTVSDGSHTITAVATNAGLNTGSGDITVLVDNEADPVVTPITVASLASSSATVNKNTWKATVTVTVNPAVSGAVVFAEWSNGTSSQCTTVNGTCSISISVSTKLTSVKFTVTNIEIAGYIYQASAITYVYVTKP